MHRLINYLYNIFDTAYKDRYLGFNIAYGLKDEFPSLAKFYTTHGIDGRFPALTEQENLREFIKDLKSDNRLELQTKRALYLQILSVNRPINTASARWEHIDRVYNHCKKILAFKIDKVEKSDILDIFEKLKLAKKSGVAKRLFNDLSNIFIYAINRDFVQNSPMTGIIKKELIYKSPIKHYATIIEKDKIQQLLGDILDCKSEIFVKIATLMSLFTAQRSFNVRSALWENLDLEKGIWQIPAVDMKMKR